MIRVADVADLGLMKVEVLAVCDVVELTRHLAQARLPTPRIGARLELLQRVAQTSSLQDSQRAAE